MLGCQLVRMACGLGYPFGIEGLAFETSSQGSLSGGENGNISFRDNLNLKFRVVIDVVKVLGLK